MKRTVLLDCDGVLADFIGGVCRTLADLGHPQHEPHHVTEFDFCKSLKLETDVARAVKQRISGEPGWWLNLEPFPSARLGVAELREVADVYVVTSPWNSHRNWLWEREAWLKKHFDIPHSHVIAASAKHLVAGDMLVDDKTEAVERWDREQACVYREIDGTLRTTFGVQWETPHNRNDGWRGRSTRSWSQLLEWAR